MLHLLLFYPIYFPACSVAVHPVNRVCINFNLTHSAVSPFKVVETSQQDYGSHFRSLYSENVRSMKKCAYHCSFFVVGFVVMYLCVTFTDVVIGPKSTINLMLTNLTIMLQK